jgi:hypothetical protein
MIRLRETLLSYRRRLMDEPEQVPSIHHIRNTTEVNTGNPTAIEHSHEDLGVHHAGIASDEAKEGQAHQQAHNTHG